MRIHWLNNLRLKYQRRYWAVRCQSDELKNLWNTPTVSTADRLLSLDLETTGLQVSSANIVSMGWVPVERDRILLAQAKHVLVACPEPMNASAAIHGLLDSDLSEGMELQFAITALLKACAGRTLLVHGAALDIGILNRTCRALFGAPLLMPFIDTLEQARAQFERRNQPINSGDLTLTRLRSRRHLPAISSHQALADAVATAELFLAERAQIQLSERS